MSDAASGPRPLLPARVARPTWRDPRFLAGAALVVVAAILGAVLVAMARGTSPVLVAQRPLVPGRPVSAADVATVEAALGPARDRYLDDPGRLTEGVVALRDVRPGEFVTADAVGAPAALRVDPVVVPVLADVAEVLAVGDRVDVWVNPRSRSAAGGGDYGTPQRLLVAAPVARLPPPRSATSAGSSRTVGVQLMVPRAQVAALLAAVDQEARVTLVPVAAPTSDPSL